MNFTGFEALSFDCYGTLIDWETGLHTALQPLLARAGVTLPRDAVLATFAEHETRQEAATPTMRYSELLSEVHAQLARAWGVAPIATESQAFGASVGDWPAGTTPKFTWPGLKTTSARLLADTWSVAVEIYCGPTLT